MKPRMIRWNGVPSYSGFFTHSPSGFFQGRTPRASPTKLATVIGALSSHSSHFKVPLSVCMFATSFPFPASPLVASSSVNTPLAGSPSLTGTFATGFAPPVAGGAGGGGAGGAALGAGACFVATGSALSDVGSGGAPDLHESARPAARRTGVEPRRARDRMGRTINPRYGRSSRLDPNVLPGADSVRSRPSGVDLQDV